MTARQVFEGMLIELSKVHAPSLLLQDFNYLFNKAINQYINKRYNIYDINQQTTDDLRVLKASAILKPTKSYGSTYNETNGMAPDISDSEDVALDDYDTGAYLSQRYNNLASLYGATYELTLPADYLHMLNCICVYKVKKTFKCYNKGSYIQFAAKRLTSDAWSTIINDFYNRPLPERPYYYIHNVNQSPNLSTNAWKEAADNNTLGTGTDIANPYTVGAESDEHSNLARTITLNGKEISLVEKPTAIRAANASTVRCEIRYGKDDTIFELVNVIVDYVKAPQHIRLTQEQLDLTEDTSQIMEFPDYVCQEIINELVTVVMENTADPRLNTHVAVSQSIAQPAQQQAAPQAQQS